MAQVYQPDTNYFGRVQSKGFTQLRNVSKLQSRGPELEVASECPEVTSELVWDIFEFFDLLFQGKEIIITSGRNKEEIILISSLPMVWSGLRVTPQITETLN